LYSLRHREIICPHKHLLQWPPHLDSDEAHPRNHGRIVHIGGVWREARQPLVADEDDMVAFFLFLCKLTERIVVLQLVAVAEALMALEATVLDKVGRCHKHS